MDRETLERMLLDLTITIDDILAADLAEDFMKVTGIGASVRQQDAEAFRGTGDKTAAPGIVSP